MTHAPLTYASTFSGIGGLDLAFERVTGARCLWSCERSAFCREIIWQQRGEDHRIVADIRSVGPTLPRVDAIVGGFPCQDVSAAGKRVGLEHGAASGLWRELSRAIHELRPAIVFCENVRGLLGRGIDHVLADLACLGFDAEWTCIRASDVGAPHRRERIFLLAYTERRGLRQLAERLEQHEAERGHAEPIDQGAHVAHAGGDAPARVGKEHDDHGPESRGHDVDGCDEGVADTARARRIVERRSAGPETSRSATRGEALEHAARDRDSRQGAGRGGWETEPVAQPDAAGAHAWPPGPDDAEAWARWTGAQPGFRRIPNGLPGWVHSARLAEALRRARLRALGNAVVQQQAAEALRRLMRAAVRGR